jgi:hypothetical protein
MPQLIMPDAPEFPLILLRVAFAAAELISESVQTLIKISLSAVWLS